MDLIREDEATRGVMGSHRFSSSLVVDGEVMRPYRYYEMRVVLVKMH
jgi:hypothetical protein